MKFNTSSLYQESSFHTKYGYCKKHHAISLLLSNHPNLIDFLYICDRSSLRSAPSKLIRKSRLFSIQNQVLIKISLDLITNRSRITLKDLYFIDTYDRCSLFFALDFLGGLKEQKCNCKICQRYK